MEICEGKFLEIKKNDFREICFDKYEQCQVIGEV